MEKEVADLFALLKAAHAGIDKMVEDVPDAQWTVKPRPNFNNIASIIEHTAIVERKFMAVLAGDKVDLDSQATFKASSWDVAAIKKEWADVLAYSESVLGKLTAADLDKFARKLSMGDVNARQLIVYNISHVTHHRGQIPLVKKLLA